MTHSCIFCRIVHGEAPAAIVYADGAITAFRDINPQASTHILIVPNEYVFVVDVLDADDAEWVGRLLIVVREIARAEGVVADGYRLVINNGAQAG
mgnify:FL=1